MQIRAKRQVDASTIEALFRTEYVPVVRLAFTLVGNNAEARSWCETASPRSTGTTLGTVNRQNPELTGRLRRLKEELDELDPRLIEGMPDPVPMLEELSYAIRPEVHERRIPSYGAIVEPVRSSARWNDTTGIEVAHRAVADLADSAVRRFADGVTSFAVRQHDGVNDLLVFDRSVGSERDLTIVAEASGATVVQRHPAGVVRAAGSFGVLRLLGFDWQLEPPVSRWLDLPSCVIDPSLREVMHKLLQFAIHDVAARNVGATFVLSRDGGLTSGAERRYGRPPDFRIDRPADLAPLYHVLGQVDGAAVFDENGMLRELGVRLVPSSDAEGTVDAFRGTRHTSALRYSFDDPEATLIVVSEDGPVSVMRAGKRLGYSR